MARKSRIEFPGAVYHVTRGNNRQKIFANDGDLGDFLKLLKRYREKFQFNLYAYSLMPNHVHMLIEAGEIPLSRVMQALQFNYTQKFNRRHKRKTDKDHYARKSWHQRKGDGGLYLQSVWRQKLRRGSQIFWLERCDHV